MGSHAENPISEFFLSFYNYGNLAVWLSRGLQKQIRVLSGQRTSLGILPQDRKLDVLKLVDFLVAVW